MSPLVPPAAAAAAATRATAASCSHQQHLDSRSMRMACPLQCCRCEPDSAPLQVAVLLSGGVDSSLALHLLAAAGHHVTAFYLQVQ